MTQKVILRGGGAALLLLLLGAAAAVQLAPMAATHAAVAAAAAEMAELEHLQRLEEQADLKVLAEEQFEARVRARQRHAAELAAVSVALRPRGDEAAHGDDVAAQREDEWRQRKLEQLFDEDVQAQFNAQLQALLAKHRAHSEASAEKKVRRDAHLHGERSGGESSNQVDRYVFEMYAQSKSELHQLTLKRLDALAANAIDPTVSVAQNWPQEQEQYYQTVKGAHSHYLWIIERARETLPRNERNAKGAGKAALAGGKGALAARNHVQFTTLNDSVVPQQTAEEFDALGLFPNEEKCEYPFARPICSGRCNQIGKRGGVIYENPTNLEEILDDDDNCVYFTSDLAWNEALGNLNAYQKEQAWRKATATSSSATSSSSSSSSDDDDDSSSSSSSSSALSDFHYSSRKVFINMGGGLDCLMLGPEIDNPDYDVYIDGGDDKDEIIVMNSRIEEVRGGAGSDMITIETVADAVGFGGSRVGLVDGESGSDVIMLNEVGTFLHFGEVNGGEGCDDISLFSAEGLIEGKKIDANDGQDWVVSAPLQGSTIDEIYLGKGKDRLVLEDANVAYTYGGEGDDFMYFELCVVGRAYGGDGNDQMTLMGSELLREFEGNDGKDSLAAYLQPLLGIYSVFDGGAGDDEIKIHDATLRSKILAGAGDDTVLLNTVLVGAQQKVELGAGDDNFYMTGSDFFLFQDVPLIDPEASPFTMELQRIAADAARAEALSSPIAKLNVYGASGADNFHVSDSRFRGKLDGGRGKDNVFLSNSFVQGAVNGRDGNDRIMAVGCDIVGVLYGDRGDDHITLHDSTTVYPANGTIGVDGYIQAGNEDPNSSSSSSSSSSSDEEGGDDDNVVKREVNDEWTFSSDDDDDDDDGPGQDTYGDDDVCEFSCESRSVKNEAQGGGFKRFARMRGCETRFELKGACAVAEDP